MSLVDRVRETLCEIDGVIESSSAFGSDEDIAFWVNGKEIAHFECDTALDIRLTRKLISEHRPRLKADPRITLRRNSSDWLTVTFQVDEDLSFLAELAELAASAHRAPPGATPKLPPTGRDLERRRRFH
jgi:hypothetical protein